MDGDPFGFAARCGQNHGFFGQHECRHAAEKMRGEDGAAHGNGLRAFDDGCGAAARVAHIKRCSSRTLR